MYVLEHKESGLKIEFEDIKKISLFLNLDYSYVKRSIENTIYKGYFKSNLKYKEGFSIEVKTIK